MNTDFKRICAPTDFSEMGDRAVEYGAALARKYGAELHIVHVIQDVADKLRHPDFTSTDTSVHEFLGKLEKGASEYLAKLAAEKPWHGLEVKRVQLIGSPVDEICRYAEKNEIDLLVMGTHGRKGLQHMFVGSVTERVVRTAPCPVLTIREPRPA